MQAIFEKTFTIRSTEVDADSNCRPSAILGFFQELATDHAEDLGITRDYLVENYHAVWLLSRVWMRLDRPLKMGETITVRTWHRGAEKLFMYRDFDILSQGNVVGEGVSAWIVADLADRKMLRPSSVERIVDSPFPAEKRKSLQLKSLHRPGALEDVYEKTVRWSDVDLNGHMNNTKYADAAMDAFSPAELRGRFLSEMYLNYTLECRPGETITVSRAETEEGFFVEGTGGGSRRFDSLLKFSSEP